MRLPVSTSRSQRGRADVAGRVVWHSVLPAAPEHAEPRAGEDARRMRMVRAAGPGTLIDILGPGGRAAAVVSPAGEHSSQSLVAGPAEADALHLAAALGHRDDARLHRQDIVAEVALAHVAD